MWRNTLSEGSVQASARQLLTIAQQQRRIRPMLRAWLISTLISVLFYIVFWLVFLFTGVEAGAAGLIQGRITNYETGEPIARATVRVEGTGLSTLSNDDGFYSIRLPKDTHRLKFSHISHYSEEVTLAVVDSSVTRDVRLRTAVVELGEVRVYDRAYDPAQEIILEAIRRKKDILEQIHDYQFEAYTKVTIRDESSPDSSELFLLAESQTTAFWEQPDKYKEIITARRQTANIQAENNLVTVGEMLNFNRNRIEVGRYRLVSPTAKDALDHYNYYLIDTIEAFGRKVFRLEVEPKNPADPLFAGVIHIADSTYDVVAVDVGVSEGVKFDFLSDLHYSQTFAQFNDEYWMPVEVRFSGTVEIKFPFPGIPDRLSFAHVASIYDYSFERGHEPGTFDEYVVEVDRNADDVDSIEWQAHQTIPLTSEEENAYQRIDSVENAPKSIGERAGQVALGAVALVLIGDENFFRFNRVEGPYAGAEVPLDRLAPHMHLHFGGGYAFDADRWQYSFGGSYLLDKRYRLRVGGEYHREIVQRSTVFSDNYNSTFLALFYKLDPFDYFREWGFSLFSDFKLIDHVRLRVEYQDLRQRSATVNTDYSIFRNDEVWRGNPAIEEGILRSVGAEFNFDSRNRFLNKGEEELLYAAQYTRIESGIEHASPEFLDNDFDFRRYWVSLFRRQRVFALGYSSLFAFAGSSDGTLPPQRYFVADFGDGAFYRARGFNTLNENNFVGQRMASVYLQHDFDDLLFARSGLPLLRKIPFTVWAHGGVFWTEFRQDRNPEAGTRERVAVTPYSEIGFGLANLTPFLAPFNLAASFTWQLSDYETSNFQFMLGIRLR
jgi:hypothetical protein